MKMKIIISALSIIAILLIFGGRFITIGYVESNERDADSFSEISLWMGVVAGLIMIVVAFWTFRIHIVAGIICPWFWPSSCSSYIALTNNVSLIDYEKCPSISLGENIFIVMEIDYSI